MKKCCRDWQDLGVRGLGFPFHLIQFKFRSILQVYSRDLILLLNTSKLFQQSFYWNYIETLQSKHVRVNLPSVTSNYTLNSFLSPPPFPHTPILSSWVYVSFHFLHFYRFFFNIRIHLNFLKTFLVPVLNCKYKSKKNPASFVCVLDVLLVYFFFFFPFQLLF